MTRHASLLRFALPLVVVAHLVGAAYAALSQELAAQALHASGTRAAIQSLSAGLGSLVDQHPDASKLTDEQRAELKRVVADAFDSQRLLQEVIAHLQSTADQSVVEKAVAVMNTDQHRRVVQLELAASDPKEESAIEQFAKGLEKRPPSKKRLALIERYGKATDAVRLGTSLRTKMLSSFGGVAESDAQIAELRPRIEAAAAADFLVRSLYAYRQLDDKRLEEHVRRMEQPAMRDASRRLGDSMVHALGRSFETFGESLRRVTGQ